MRPLDPEPVSPAVYGELLAVAAELLFVAEIECQLVGGALVQGGVGE